MPRDTVLTDTRLPAESRHKEKRNQKVKGGWSRRGTRGTSRDLLPWDKRTNAPQCPPCHTKRHCEKEPLGKHSLAFSY